MIAPTPRASRPASASRSDPSPAAASGMIAAATSGDTAESGPSARIRDGPSRKYTTSGTKVAYSPATGRQARRLGIRHALGHEQRGEHDTGADVAAQRAAARTV